FPDGVSCEFLKAFECDMFGGRNMGPGPCAPNPCVTTTTTLPGTAARPCPRAVSMPSVACRLAELLGMVGGAGDLHRLGAELLAPLNRAGTRMSKAEQLQTAGKNGPAREALR